MLRFEYIPTNGIVLHTALAGPTSGPPVILLHGFPEYWRGWHHQLDALADAGFRVIAPDQRGYNLSDKPVDVNAYDVRHLTADILGLADSLGYERFHLAGHDWGAIVSWRLAMDHPERLRKLAIANVPHPQVFTETIRSNPEQLARSWYVGFFQLKPLTEAVLRANDFDALLGTMRQSSRWDTFTEADYVRYREAWGQPGALTSMLNWYRAAFRSFARGRLGEGRVTVPTLMLWGRRDIALSHTMAQPSIALCDEGRLVFYDRATHWVQHDEPDAVSTELIAHFSAEPPQ